MYHRTYVRYAHPVIEEVNVADEQDVGNSWALATLAELQDFIRDGAFIESIADEWAIGGTRRVTLVMRRRDQ